MLKFLFRSFNQCPSVINWWGQMTGLIFFRLPHTAKTWLVWSVTPGVSRGWGEVVADGRSGDVRAGGSLTITTFHLHLVAMSPLPAPPPKSSGHDPEGVVSYRWSPSLSAFTRGLRERSHRCDAGCFVSEGTSHPAGPVWMLANQQTHGNSKMYEYDRGPCRKTAAPSFEKKKKKD